MLIVLPQSEPLVPTTGPEDWKQFLAEPEKQWKNGRSAKLMAETWEAAAPRWPSEIAAALLQTELGDAVPFLAIPEYQVPLPGGSRPSQNDLFVLSRNDSGLIVTMVEGKVDEPFGPELSEWLGQASQGKSDRLGFLKEKLGISEPPLDLRYQLLHRTASAVIEAERLGATHAVMIVHSFSKAAAWYDDYSRFTTLLGVQPNIGTVTVVPGRAAPKVWLGWVEAERAV